MYQELVSPTVDIFKVIVLAVTIQASPMVHSRFFTHMPGQCLYNPTGLLAEYTVTDKMRCLVQCRDKCNLALYHATKSLCRLHMYNHIGSGGNSTEEGWQYYGESCKEPLGVHACDSSYGVLTDCGPDKSCLSGDTWTDANIPCLLYSDSDTEDGSLGSITFNLGSTINPNMKVYAHLKMAANPENKSEMSLTKISSGLTFFAEIEMNWGRNETTCKTKDDFAVSSYGIKSDSKSYKLAIFVLTTGTRMYVDGQLMATFGSVYTGLDSIRITNPQAVFSLQVVKVWNNCV